MSSSLPSGPQSSILKESWQVEELSSKPEALCEGETTHFPPRVSYSDCGVAGRAPGR